MRTFLLCHAIFVFIGTQASAATTYSATVKVEALKVGTSNGSTIAFVTMSQATLSYDGEIVQPILVNRVEVAFPKETGHDGWKGQTTFIMKIFARNSFSRSW